MTPLPTQSNVQAALRSFLLSILPAGTPVSAGQVNRVAEPKAPAYCIFTPLRFQRLRTNVDSDQDVKFTGSIAGNTLTVSHVFDGELALGATVFGVGVADGSTITAFGTGSGSTGSYTVSQPQTLSSRTLSAGQKAIEQGIQWTFQVDFHSADNSSGDMATVFSTLMRDEYATTQFASQNPNYGVAPLYADDPKQLPFSNDQQQVENRWTVEAVVQSNAVVEVAQQYADSVDVAVISVDATYPP